MQIRLIKRTQRFHEPPTSGSVKSGHIYLLVDLPGRPQTDDSITWSLDWESELVEHVTWAIDSPPELLLARTVKGNAAVQEYIDAGWRPVDWVK